jgi:hypothetical protein
MAGMLWALLVAQAGAETPASRDSDILTDTTVPVAPEAMLPVLSDLARFKLAVPPSCLGRFEVGTPSSGKGATARVRYDMAAMHRPLTLTLTRLDVEATRLVVDYDHPTNLGFTTRWVVEAVEGGSHVHVQTAISAPAWPFTAYYYAAVQPEWVACQATIVANVAKLAAPPAP